MSLDAGEDPDIPPLPIFPRYANIACYCRNAKRLSSLAGAIFTSSDWNIDVTVVANSFGF